MGTITKAFNDLQPHVIFKGLTTGASGALINSLWLIFAGLGVVILAAGHVNRAKAAGARGEKQVDELVKTLFLFGLMMSSPFLVSSMHKAADAIAAGTGLNSPLLVAQKCAAVAFSMPELTTMSGLDIVPRPDIKLKADQDKAIKDALDQGGYWGNIKAFLVAYGQTWSDAGRTVWDSAVNILSLANTLLAATVKIILVILTIGLLLILLFIASGISWFAEAARFFLLVMGTILMPTAIACYSTNALRSQGHNYVLGMVAVACWPLGWVLGHAGTVVLYNSWLSMASGTSTASAYFTSMKWDNLETYAQSILTHNPTAIQQMEQVGRDLVMGHFTTGALSFAIGGIGIVIWIFLVTVFAPVLITRVILTGGSFYGPMLQSTAAQAVKVAETAAQLALAASGVPAPIAAGLSVGIAGGAESVGGAINGQPNVSTLAGAGVGAVQAYGAEKERQSQTKDESERANRGSQQLSVQTQLLQQIAQSLRKS